MIGTDSGPLGDVLVPYSQGGRAWVQDVNARGGLDGHPVRLVAADDGGDPGKALALARRMIDQDHVIGFLGEHAPASFQAVMPLLEERKIPVFGSCSCTPRVAQSPMTFDIAVGGDRGAAWGHVAPLVALSDKRKASIFYCGEVPVCRLIRDRIVNEFAQPAGVKIVHEARVTISQPDYTAELLAARNAGAEAIISTLDTASIGRVARSAHRQDYRPVLVTQWSGHDHRNIERNGDVTDGQLIGDLAPPWESPKMAEYRVAMDRYIPGAIKSGLGPAVFYGGKLLEAAVNIVPLSAQPNSADILKAFYSLKGETLGGLFPPVTFVEGQPFDGTNNCIYPVKLEKRKFIAPKGDTWYLCSPGWRPRQK